jgi:diaminopimelate epimerase
MKITKLQGLGNDFILVDGRETSRANWNLIARAICDRRLGVGSDGLLVLLAAKTADFRMRMFNPDGSEAEACGNGLRCFVRFISENKLNSCDKLRIETKAGMRRALIVREKGKLAGIKVSMGQPQLELSEIPVVASPNRGKLFGEMLGDYPLEAGGFKLKLDFVSMGNPHAIYFISNPLRSFPLNEIGPLVENNKLFPNHVNFEIACLLGANKLEMRVWERGAGLTLACGTGACAVFVAARQRGLVGNQAEIKLPGGKAEVSWDGKDEAYLKGPAEVVFTGFWPERS